MKNFLLTLFTFSLYLMGCTSKAATEMPSPTVPPSPIATYTLTATITPTDVLLPTYTPTVDITSTQIALTQSKSQSISFYPEVDPICEKGTSLPDTTPYNPKQPPFPILINFEDGDFRSDEDLADVLGDFDKTKHLDISRWIPKSLSEVQLVLCEKSNEIPPKIVGSCYYTAMNGRTVPLYLEQVFTVFNLYSSHDGKQIQRLVVPSDIPTIAKCPETTNSIEPIVGEFDSKYFNNALYNLLQLNTAPSQ